MSSLTGPETVCTVFGMLPLSRFPLPRPSQPRLDRLFDGLLQARRPCVPAPGSAAETLLLIYDRYLLGTSPAPN